MSTIKVNAIRNTSDVEMYLARAWVNFNGTGTVAIRASGNVSSITDNGTGDYTVNFTTALADGLYAHVGTCKPTGNNAPVVNSKFNVSPLSGSCRIATHLTNVGDVDVDYISVCFFR